MMDHGHRIVDRLESRPVYLEAHEEVNTVLVVESVGTKGLASGLHLCSLLRRAGVGIELP
jgi:hypothetical protein